jgi:hypothetical protein
VFLEEFDANYFDLQPLHFGLADRKLRAICSGRVSVRAYWWCSVGCCAEMEGATPVVEMLIPTSSRSRKDTQEISDYPPAATIMHNT